VQRRTALPWRVFLGCPACIQPIFRLYLTESLVSRCVSLYLSASSKFAAQIHGISLYLPVSSCIRPYLAVSNCIPLYLTVSVLSQRPPPPPHRLETMGYGQKYTPGEGYVRNVSGAVPPFFFSFCITVYSTVLNVIQRIILLK